MTKVAYFDCFSGCSGDMMLGALLDAGLDLDTLEKGLDSLDIGKYQLTMEKVTRASITATKFNVETDTREHHHRPLKDILSIIKSSRLSKSVRQKSSAIFRKLGEAEAKVHGVDINEVEFHELGAVDTIIDIVGTVFALEQLNIERVFASPLPVGSGSVTTAHGILPVPAPATLHLLTDSKAPLVSLSDTTGAPVGELVTPTGAALLTSLANFCRPDLSVDQVGYGAGSKDFKNWPNIIRVWIGETTGDAGQDNLILLETNIDDMNPQTYGYLMEKLFSEKAVDVWFTPIQMKKNRPAILLSVLAPSHAEAKLIDIIMKETTTLGIRIRPVSRHIAHREIIEFDSSLGHTRIKVKRFAGQVLDISPEYEDCRQIALAKDIPLQEVMRTIEIEARQRVA